LTQSSNYQIQKGLGASRPYIEIAGGYEGLRTNLTNIGDVVLATSNEQRPLRVTFAG